MSIGDGNGGHYGQFPMSSKNADPAGRDDHGPSFPDEVGERLTEEELLKGLEGAGYLPTQKEPLLSESAIKARFEKDWNPECIHGRVIKEGDDWCPECKAAGQPKSEGRRFLPTLSDLVDRLTIVQLKMIFISEHKEAYLKEREDIEHDIDLIIREKDIRFGANEIHAVVMLMLCNRFIWENESRARAGGSEQDKLLKLTHSINGIRNASKNKLAVIDGGRKDYKIDALAADLPPEFGNWSVF
jgi:hypothetical protein